MCLGISARRWVPLICESNQTWHATLNLTSSFSRQRHGCVLHSLTTARRRSVLAHRGLGAEVIQLYRFRGGLCIIEPSCHIYELRPEGDRTGGLLNAVPTPKKLSYSDRY